MWRWHFANYLLAGTAFYVRLRASIEEGENNSTRIGQLENGTFFRPLQIAPSQSAWTRWNSLSPHCFCFPLFVTKPTRSADTLKPPSLIFSVDFVFNSLRIFEKCMELRTMQSLSNPLLLASKSLFGSSRGDWLELGNWRLETTASWRKEELGKSPSALAFLTDDPFHFGSPFAMREWKFHPRLAVYTLTRQNWGLLDSFWSATRG